MPTTFPYPPNTGDAHELLKVALLEYMPWLIGVGARIDTILAKNEDGPAVVLHGYPCIATIKVNNLKTRALGQGDAVITIDADIWEPLTRPQKLAILHHEIYHLVVKKIKHDPEATDPAKKWTCERDSRGRPKLTCKHHDWEIGGFKEVAEMHGDDAAEVIQASAIAETYGEVLKLGRGRSGDRQSRAGAAHIADALMERARRGDVEPLQKVVEKGGSITISTKDKSVTLTPRPKRGEA